MASLTGTFAGSGIATTASGAQTAYRLVVPEKATGNLGTIAAESQRWRQTADEYRRLAAQAALDPAYWRRAQFAEEVLALMGIYLNSGICCMVMAQSADGRILGVSSYGTFGMQEGAIHLQAISPEHLVGSPGQAQLRGIGTALVAAASRDLLRRGVETLYIHPLDDAAAKFWTGRGFVPCGLGGRMCVRGKTEIEKMIDGCIALPACSPAGECLLCGTMRLTAAVRLPQNR